MEAILEQLVRSPKLRHYVAELNETVRREEEARQRFYRNLDEEVREEFINGEVVRQMTSRDSHSMAIRNIGRLMDIFAAVRGLGAVRTEQALTVFPRNDYAPDICFWTAAKSARFTGETTKYPVPDFICEVLSSSTEARDRGVKFEDYAFHGVAEYWLVEPDERFVEQYFARDGVYELAGKFTSDVVRSRAIEGFELPVAAAFDEGANLEALWKLRPESGKP
jgi:Uma2 family endonuclease